MVGTGWEGIFQLNSNTLNSISSNRAKVKRPYAKRRRVLTSAKGREISKCNDERNGWTGGRFEAAIFKESVRATYQQNFFVWKWMNFEIPEAKDIRIIKFLIW